MRHDHAASDSKVPLLPLVDILFSAFAAVLGTATVAVAMIRTSVPDSDRPELPYFTIVATSSDAKCTKTLRPKFLIKLPSGNEIEFEDVSMFNGATDTAPKSAVINAWYFSETSNDEQLDKLCPIAGGCVRAELAVLTAKPGVFTVIPAIKDSTCQDVRLDLRLGPLNNKVDHSNLREQNQVKTITFQVQQ
ncbi:hypothetical protein ABIF63_000031 [Bradyrhizobium japonicum]|uniref:Uncharacterized protein n=1 Tax=Bradyrhizobium japonicum TaxID=375 RepID=A0ABV2RG73_BRAJP